MPSKKTSKFQIKQSNSRGHISHISRKIKDNYRYIMKNTPASSITNETHVEILHDKFDKSISSLAHHESIENRSTLVGNISESTFFVVLCSPNFLEINSIESIKKDLWGIKPLPLQHTALRHTDISDATVRIMREARLAPLHTVEPLSNAFIQKNMPPRSARYEKITTPAQAYDSEATLIISPKIHAKASLDIQNPTYPHDEIKGEFTNKFNISNSSLNDARKISVYFSVEPSSLMTEAVPTAVDAVELARQRGAKVRTQVLSSSEVLTTAEVAQLLQVDEWDVDQLRQTKNLLALSTAPETEDHKYPKWQFHSTLFTRIKDLMNIFSHYDGWTVRYFMRTSSLNICEQSPLDLLNNKSSLTKLSANELFHLPITQETQKIVAEIIKIARQHVLEQN